MWRPGVVPGHGIIGRGSVGGVSLDRPVFRTTSPGVYRAGPKWIVQRGTGSAESSDLNLKKMTHAIAHHDFAGARAYSIEDLKAREELRRLRDRYGFDDDEMAVR